MQIGVNLCECKSPAQGFVLKIERYAQRLTKDLLHMVAPTNGLLVAKIDPSTPPPPPESFYVFIHMYRIYDLKTIHHILTTFRSHWSTRVLLGMAEMWNSLPLSLKVSSKPQFKSELKKVLLNILDMILKMIILKCLK